MYTKPDEIRSKIQMEMGFNEKMARGYIENARNASNQDNAAWFVN